MSTNLTDAFESFHQSICLTDTQSSRIETARKSLADTSRVTLALVTKRSLSKVRMPTERPSSRCPEVNMTSISGRSRRTAVLLPTRLLTRYGTH